MSRGNRARGYGWGAPATPALPTRGRRPVTLAQLPELGEYAASPVLLRLELPDRPGSLAIVAGVLASCSVNILRVEVLGQSDGNAVDDFLLEGGDLQLALFRLGPYVRVLAHEPHKSLPDPGVAMAHACVRIARARTLERAAAELLESAIGLVRADQGVVLQLGPSDRLEPVTATVPGLGPILRGGAALARTALASGHVLATEVDEEWAPPSYAERLGRGASALVPLGPRAGLILAVVRAGAVAFASAELARLEGLADFATGAFATLATQRSSSVLV